MTENLVTIDFSTKKENFTVQQYLNNNNYETNI